MGSPEKAACLVDDFFSEPGRLQEWKNQIMQARQSICWEDRKIVEIFSSLRDSNPSPSCPAGASE